MKLILKQEVAGLGGAGDIVEVRDGYGRNYLVPQGFAILASRGAEKQAEVLRKARQVREVRDLSHAQELAGQLRTLDVRLAVRAGKEGRLFGSVTAADVAEAVSGAGGPALDRRRIELPSPIKTTGSHRVTVRLHPEVSADFAVEVVAG